METHRRPVARRPRTISVEISASGWERALELRTSNRLNKISAPVWLSCKRLHSFFLLKNPVNLGRVPIWQIYAHPGAGYPKRECALDILTAAAINVQWLLTSQPMSNQCRFCLMGISSTKSSLFSFCLEPIKTERVKLCVEGTDQSRGNSSWLG